MQNAQKFDVSKVLFNTVQMENFLGTSFHEEGELKTVMLILRWSETKNLNILTINNFFSCHLVVMKFCVIMELGNI